MHWALLLTLVVLAVACRGTPHGAVHPAESPSRVRSCCSRRPAAVACRQPRRLPAGSLAAWVATGRIEGRVLWRGAPERAPLGWQVGARGVLAGIPVEVRGGDRVVARTRTDATGTFRTKPLPGGHYVVRALPAGWPPAEMVVEIAPGSVTLVAFALHPRRRGDGAAGRRR